MHSHHSWGFISSSCDRERRQTVYVHKACCCGGAGALFSTPSVIVCFVCLFFLSKQRKRGVPAVWTSTKCGRLKRVVNKLVQLRLPQFSPFCLLHFSLDQTCFLCRSLHASRSWLCSWTYFTSHTHSLLLGYYTNGFEGKKNYPKWPCWCSTVTHKVSPLLQCWNPQWGPSAHPSTKWSTVNM